MDARLWGIINATESFRLITINKLDDYLNLIWQANSHTSVLTPGGEPRTLRDCVQRISSAGGSFQALVDDDHSWFKSCIRIEQNFVASSFGWLTIQDATEHEKRKSPGGQYYIYDGVHRSIVLAKLLMGNALDFEPVPCLHVPRNK